MAHSRNDLSLAFQKAVHAHGRKNANEILSKAVGADGFIAVGRVDDDKIDAAIKALKAVKAPIKSLSDIHSSLADIGSKLSEKKNEHRT